MLLNIGRFITNRSSICHILTQRRPSLYKRYCNNLFRKMSVASSTSSTKNLKVYVTRRIPESALNSLSSRYEVTRWDSDEPVSEDELLRNVPGIDALFCLLTDQITSKVLHSAGPNLKVVGTMSVGHDHLDLQTCKKLCIPVGYTPDVLTDATAELTVALLLTTSRKIIPGLKAVKEGEWSTWKPMWMCGQGLLNSTVGIVGLGRIGYAVAERLKPFGPNAILYSGNKPKDNASIVGAAFVDLGELLRRSDFVIATCPMNKETIGMFNKEVFKKMKKTAIFINTSRGGVVNQEDLYDALVRGEIAAAGLDVTLPEPLPTDHKLLSLENCVILPHIGSATIETRTLMAEITANNIIAVLDGKPMPCPLQF